MKKQTVTKPKQAFDFAVKHGKRLTKFSGIEAAWTYWWGTLGGVLLVHADKGWRRAF